MVTLRDVAAEAGVSPMTVSNTVTGRKPVSPQTRERVMAAVERLGYQVNVAARNLRQGRTGVVGIAVPSLDSQYYGRLTQTLVEAFAGAGLRAVVEVTHSSREGELAAFQDSRHNAYDGLVITALELSETELAHLGRDLPVVVLGEQELHHSVDHVRMPNVAGAEAAATVLLERECRRLAVVGTPPAPDPDGPPAPERFAFDPRAEGFRAAVARHPGARAVEVHSGSAQEDGRRSVVELLAAAEPPDGIFCVTDTLALGVLRGLWDHGVRAPDDVLVVGFDDVADARFSFPSLSTVAPDHDALVGQAVDLLTTRMADPTLPARERTVSFTVVERESTHRPTP